MKLYGPSWSTKATEDTYNYFPHSCQPNWLNRFQWKNDKEKTAKQLKYGLMVIEAYKDPVGKILGT